jgi:hypothetical protein
LTRDSSNTTQDESHSGRVSLRRPLSAVAKIRAAINDSLKYNSETFIGTYPTKHKSTGSCIRSGIHGKEGTKPYEPLQHDNRSTKNSLRISPTSLTPQRTSTNLDKENEIDDAKLLSRYTLDITSLTTASMDFSLPSIGISTAPSLARTSTECSKNDEVEKNNEITTVNKQVVVAVTISELDTFKNGERDEGTEEDGGEEGIEIKAEREGEKGEGEGEIKINGAEIEEMKEIPASLSTIPNRYCSLIEAQGLKQLISIPLGKWTFYFPLFSYFLVSGA